MTRKYGLSSAELGQLREVTVPSRLREHFSGIARLRARESCAALYGGIQDSMLAIADWRSLTNHASSEDHFLVAVEELLRPPAHPAEPNSAAVQRTSPPAARSREPLVGLLHTHPHAPSHPSDTDRIGIAQLPFVWVIVGVGPEGITDLRSFTWSTDGIRELPTRIAPDSGSRQRPGSLPRHWAGAKTPGTADMPAAARITHQASHRCPGLSRNDEFY